MRYWVENWDFECPTLFSIGLEDLEKVIEEWPKGINNRDVDAGRAVANSYGELLWGASALSNAKMVELLELPKKEVEKFYKSIHEEMKVIADE